MEKHCEISQEIVPSFHILKTYEFVVTLLSHEILNRLRRFSFYIRLHISHLFQNLLLNPWIM